MGLLKPLWGSNVENLAGNAGELAQSANDITRNVNDQLGSHGLQDILSLGKDLAKSATFANYTSAFSTMYATYKNKNASENQRAIARQIEEANGKLSSIEESNTISANTQHQNDFGKSVYSFLSQQIEMSKTNNSTASTVANSNEPHLDHYFFVLHPSNDWHPAFEEIRRKEKNPLPGFIGYTMDRFALGLYLHHMREAIGTGPTFHVLVPSAKEYRLPGVVDVDPAIPPLIIEDQVMQNGTPYCSATITGLDNQYIRSVENLPSPQLLDDQKVGYRSTSENVVFKAPATLSARCRTHEGIYNDTSIDLDKLLGVKDGAFEVGDKDFSQRVTNTTLDADGVTLRATISQTEGQTQACAINLDSVISNDNGVLRKYGALSPAEKAKAGLKGTVAGLLGGSIGAIGGPAGMAIGATVGATVVGAGAEEKYERQKRDDQSCKNTTAGNVSRQNPSKSEHPR